MTGTDDGSAADAASGSDGEAAADGSAGPGEPTTEAVEVPTGDVADRLSGTEGLLVGLDFDGTLAPIADDPDEPSITPACRRALDRFVTASDATVAVISGRALADLRSRVGLDGVIYAGNHGLELSGEERSTVHPEARSVRPALARAIERIRDRLPDTAAIEVEDKGLTATVHYRQAPPDRTGEVQTAVSTAVCNVGDLVVTAGKEVFELRPRIDWDKGSTISRIAEATPEDWMTVYVGDDTTDEDAFGAVRPEGVGVLVGDRDTDATMRLPGQAAVAPFLQRLADATLESDA
jgi:trehalose 6-phosphate phosphatase